MTMSISLARRALRIRRSIITMLAHAQSGHSAGPLGMADVFAMLYFDILKHDPHQPHWPDRDRVILSNGHICPVLYATLAEAGYFSRQELFTLRQIDSRLQGHPHLGSVPGVENTSGPLGQGLSQACGLSLALRLDENPARVFALLSDGEQQEGQTWEAYQFAAKEQLNNLTVLIDRNNIQIDGPTEEIMPLDPLKEKIASFNWQVLSIDGHDHGAIKLACEEAAQETNKPTAIICNTIPGKGVSFMEGKYQWHGKPPSAEEAEQALAELTLEGGDND